MRRAAIALSAALGGCMVGPDYQRPEVSAPGAFRYEPQKVEQTADTEWWKQFGDPVLDGYIIEALAHNRNVQTAVANVEQAAGVLTTTRSPLFPQLSYQADGTRQRYSELVRSQQLAAAVGGNPATTYQVLAGATWEGAYGGSPSRRARSC